MIDESKSHFKDILIIAYNTGMRTGELRDLKWSYIDRKANILNAGVDKVHRDLILGHSLKGMDVHYLAPNDDSLKEAMDKYTRWLGDKIAEASKELAKKQGSYEMIV